MMVRAEVSGAPHYPSQGAAPCGALGGLFYAQCNSLATCSWARSNVTQSVQQLATNYFHLAKAENPAIRALDLGYFTPESAHYRDYLNAVAAGGNFAIVNRLAMFEQIAAAFHMSSGSRCHSCTRSAVTCFSGSIIRNSARSRSIERARPVPLPRTTTTCRLVTQS